MHHSGLALSFLLDKLPSKKAAHHVAVNIFVVVVFAHWVEHLVQAVQIYAFGWPRPRSLGMLGLFYPQLISSEWLHYAYAVVMLLGFAVLLAGFHGPARTWWLIALSIQFWHHIEHALLLYQAFSGHFLFGSTYPTSVLQLFFPRVELHLFYNAMVTIPMLLAIYCNGRCVKKNKALVGGIPPP